jgi:hypothetical protein
MELYYSYLCLGWASVYHNKLCEIRISRRYEDEDYRILDMIPHRLVERFLCPEHRDSKFCRNLVPSYETTRRHIIGNSIIYSNLY